MSNPQLDQLVSSSLLRAIEAVEAAMAESKNPPMELFPDQLTYLRNRARFVAARQGDRLEFMGRFYPITNAAGMPDYERLSNGEYRTEGGRKIYDLGFEEAFGGFGKGRMNLFDCYNCGTNSLLVTTKLESNRNLYDRATDAEHLGLDATRFIVFDSEAGNAREVIQEILERMQRVHPLTIITHNLGFLRLIREGIATPNEEAFPEYRQEGIRQRFVFGRAIFDEADRYVCGELTRPIVEECMRWSTGIASSATSGKIEVDLLPGQTRIGSYPLDAGIRDGYGPIMVNALIASVDMMPATAATPDVQRWRHELAEWTNSIAQDAQLGPQVIQSIDLVGRLVNGALTALRDYHDHVVRVLDTPVLFHTPTILSGELVANFLNDHFYGPPPAGATAVEARAHRRNIEIHGNGDGRGGFVAVSGDTPMDDLVRGRNIVRFGVRTLIDRLNNGQQRGIVGADVLERAIDIQNICAVVRFGLDNPDVTIQKAARGTRAPTANFPNIFGREQKSLLLLDVSPAHFFDATHPFWGEINTSVSPRAFVRNAMTKTFAHMLRHPYISRIPGDFPHIDDTRPGRRPESLPQPSNSFVHYFDYDAVQVQRVGDAAGIYETAEQNVPPGFMTVSQAVAYLNSPQIANEEILRSRIQHIVEGGRYYQNGHIVTSSTQVSENGFTIPTDGSKPVQTYTRRDLLGTLGRNTIISLTLLEGIYLQMRQDVQQGSMTVETIAEQSGVTTAEIQRALERIAKRAEEERRRGWEGNTNMRPGTDSKEVRPGEEPRLPPGDEKGLDDKEKGTGTDKT